MSHENECRATIIEVNYPAQRGVIGLRGGKAPLSWDHTTKRPPSMGIGTSSS